METQTSPIPAGGHRLIIAAVVLVFIIAGAVFFYKDALFTSKEFVVDERVQEALTSFEANDFGSALEKAETLIKSSDKNDQLAGYLIKASVEVQQASFTFDEAPGAEAAIASAQQALAIDPNNAQALRVIGYAYEIMQDYPQAHEYYDMSLTVDQENVETLTNKGHAFDLQGRLTEAAMLYEKALTIDNSYEPALLNMMRLEYRRENIPAATEIASRLMQSTNVNVKGAAYQMLGVAALDSFDMEAAQRNFSQALQLNPNDPTLLTSAAHAEFGVRFWTTDETNTAELEAAVVPFLQKSLAINPENARAHLMYYKLYSYLSDVSGLAEHAQKKAAARSATLAAIGHDITLTALEKAAMQEWFDIEADILNNQ